MGERKWCVDHCHEDGFVLTPDGHYIDPILGVTRTIIIRKIPLGPAPKNIRRAWIGEVLEGFVGASDYLHLFDESHVPGRQEIIVPLEHAMKALRNSGKDNVAQWFEDNFSKRFNVLGFGVDEVEILMESSKVD